MNEKNADIKAYQKAICRRNEYDLPKGCWILLGYSFAFVLVVGGLLLLYTLSHFGLIRRFFLTGHTIAIVVVSLLILAGGIMLAIVTTNTLIHSIPARSSDPCDED